MEESSRTCEHCGAAGSTRKVEGWWATLCDACLEREQRCALSVGAAGGRGGRRCLAPRSASGSTTCATSARGLDACVHRAGGHRAARSRRRRRDQPRPRPRRRGDVRQRLRGRRAGSRRRSRRRGSCRRRSASTRRTSSAASGCSARSRASSGFAAREAPMTPDGACRPADREWRADRRRPRRSRCRAGARESSTAAGAPRAASPKTAGCLACTALRETTSAEYAERTRANVRDSDGTVVFTRGEPQRAAARSRSRTPSRIGKPVLHVDLANARRRGGSRKSARLVRRGLHRRPERRRLARISDRRPESPPFRVARRHGRATYSPLRMTPRRAFNLSASPLPEAATSSRHPCHDFDRSEHHKGGVHLD